MSEEQQPIPQWPQYPQGLRVTSPAHSRLLFKAIKTAGKIAQRKIKVPHPRKGLIAKDEVAIKHGGPRFW